MESFGGIETIKLTKGGRIRRGRTEIEVPHKDGYITFIYPLIGPGTYEEVMKQIDSERDLLRPTTAQMFSLLNSVLDNQNEPHCAEILERFASDSGTYLWTCTESITTPEGIFVVDNVDGKMPETYRDLTRKLRTKKLGKKDSPVRFVPLGREKLKEGEMSIEEFLNHPYLIAHAGEDMHGVAARIIKDNPNSSRTSASIRLEDAGWLRIDDDKKSYAIKRVTILDGRVRFALGGSINLMNHNKDGYSLGVLNIAGK